MKKMILMTMISVFSNLCFADLIHWDEVLRADSAIFSGGNGPGAYPSPDGRFIGDSYIGNGLRILDRKTGQVLHEVSKECDQGDFYFLPSDQVVTYGWGQTKDCKFIAIVDLKTFKEKRFATPWFVRTMSVNALDKHILSVRYDNYWEDNDQNTWNLLAVIYDFDGNVLRTNYSKDSGYALLGYVPNSHTLVGYDVKSGDAVFVTEDGQILQRINLAPSTQTAEFFEEEIYLDGNVLELLYTPIQSRVKGNTLRILKGKPAKFAVGKHSRGRTVSSIYLNLETKEVHSFRNYDGSKEAYWLGKNGYLQISSDENTSRMTYRYLDFSGKEISKFRGARGAVDDNVIFTDTMFVFEANDLSLYKAVNPSTGELIHQKEHAFFIDGPNGQYGGSVGDFYMIDANNIRIWNKKNNTFQLYRLNQ